MPDILPASWTNGKEEKDSEKAGTDSSGKPTKIQTVIPYPPTLLAAHYTWQGFHYSLCLCHLNVTDSS